MRCKMYLRRTGRYSRTCHGVTHSAFNSFVVIGTAKVSAMRMRTLLLPSLIAALVAAQHSKPSVGSTEVCSLRRVSSDDLFVLADAFISDREAAKR
jgi:hypothetical protein